ncbi:hypothetical protein GPU89_00655 [Burkholderia cepacia]|nr:hypothetical protein [Burkholderia cepacia]
MAFQERDGLLDAAAHARVRSREHLIFGHHRARELPAALHQRLNILQRRIRQRFGEPRAHRIPVELAGQ